MTVLPLSFIVYPTRNVIRVLVKTDLKYPSQELGYYTLASEASVFVYRVINEQYMI